MEVKQNCYQCKFKTNCVFNELQEEARKQWDSSRISVKFKNGETVYNEKDMPKGVYVVCQGRVKIYSTDYMGQQLINWIRHPGELFSHLALFSGKEYTCNAEAMGDSIISFVNKKNFYSLMENHREVYGLMLQKIALESRAMEIKVKDTAYKPAKAKVAHTLIKYISFKTKNTAAPAIYGLKRTEIAEITGLALETVVRILSDFEKKKIIERSPTYIKISDYPALLKVSTQQK